MDPAVVLTIVNGVFDILDRHRGTTTEPLTREKVHKELMDDIASGKLMIDQELLRLGVEPPK